MLIRELAHDGFIGERVGEATKPAEPKEVETISPIEENPRTIDLEHLAVELPKDGMTPTAMENLRRLVASKETLLKKALGTDSLPIRITSYNVCYTKLLRRRPKKPATNCYRAEKP